MSALGAEAREIRAAAEKLDRWVEAEGFRGYEPHDALNSPVLGRLCFGSRVLGIALVQTLRRCPVNLRPLLGIPKRYNPKAFGLFLSSYVRKYTRSGRAQDLDRVRFFGQWLRQHRAPGYAGACWGYPFPWPNRAFFVPEGTPTVVNTACIAAGFLDVYEGLNDEAALGVARSACDFFLEDLNRLETPEGQCFSYTPLDRRFVHNASMLAAAVLARTGSHTGESALLREARRAAAFTVSRQSEAGGWAYGEGAGEGWVDGFHTGFVLCALADCGCFGEDPAFERALLQGYRFYKAGFFLRGEVPKYYFNGSYPVDVHSAAQAVLTFLRLRGLDDEAVAQARRVALWTVRHMQARSGYFYYQVHRLYRNRIPYMRWGQAWMQRALVELLMVEEARP